MKTFFLTLILSLNILFIPQAKAVNLGPFAVSESFCQDIDKLGAILNSFQIVQWPVAGAPGIVAGLTQRTSVINDICGFITQLSQLEGVNAIFFSANYLNELTGKKWDHHLKQADKTWNLANSVYDFDNGGVRPGALTSQSTARDLNDWMESSYSWHQKTFNNTEAYVKHRQEREGEMQELSRNSYKIAILKDATNCPTPPDNVDYQKIYSGKVQPAEAAREVAKEDMDFFKQQLYYMGPFFMNNEGEHERYVQDLQVFEREIAGYKMESNDKNQATYKNSKSVDAEDHVIMKKEKLTTTTYKYTIDTLSTAKKVSEFTTKWSDQWQSYVTAKWTSAGTFGALTGDAKQNVENDFIDLGYECNPTRVGKGLNREDPEYESILQQKISDCRKNTHTDQKKAASLLDYYITEYSKALSSYKQANATIWTIESESTGVNHLISTKKVEVAPATKGGNGSSFQQEEISCSDKLSEAEMGLLQIKINNEIAAAALLSAKETMKMSTIMENNEIEKNEFSKHEQQKAAEAEITSKNQHEVMEKSPQAPFKTPGL